MKKYLVDLTNKLILAHDLDIVSDDTKKSSSHEEFREHVRDTLTYDRTVMDMTGNTMGFIMEHLRIEHDVDFRSDLTECVKLPADPGALLRTITVAALSFAIWERLCRPTSSGQPFFRRVDC